MPVRPTRPARAAVVAGALGLLLPLAALGPATAGPAPDAASAGAPTAGAAGTAGSPVPEVTAFDAEPDHAHDAAGSRAIRRWPKGRVTYVDLTKDSAAVRAATRAWNTSGVKVKFKKVKKRSKAALVIRNSRNVPGGCGTGLATLGHVPGGKAFVNILHGTDADGQGCAFPGQTLVVAHELGHVLGLTHDDSRCSVMNTSHVNGVAQRHCLGEDLSTAAKPGRWRCRILEKVDLKRAARLYGGKPQVAEQEWCDAIERIPATGPLLWDPSRYGGVMSVVRGPEPEVPAWLGTWGYGAPGVEVHATPGACTAVPGDQATRVDVTVWDVPVGGTEEVYWTNRTPGLHCLSAWQFDRGYNYAHAPSTVMVTIP